MIALDVLGFSEFSGERLEHGRDVREHQSRARAHERGEEPRRFLSDVRLRGMFEFGDELEEVSSQSRERVRRVPRRQSSDESNGDESHVRRFVVQRDEERAKRLRLTEVRVRDGRGTTEGCQHRASHVRVQVGDGGGEQTRHDVRLRAGGPRRPGDHRRRRRVVSAAETAVNAPPSPPPAARSLRTSSRRQHVRAASRRVAASSSSKYSTALRRTKPKSVEWPKGNVPSVRSASRTRAWCTRREEACRARGVGGERSGVDADAFARLPGDFATFAPRGVRGGDP